MAAMAAQDVLDDGEPQPRAAELARARGLDPEEALGQARQVLGRGTTATAYLPVAESTNEPRLSSNRHEAIT